MRFSDAKFGITSGESQNLVNNKSMRQTKVKNVNASGYLRNLFIIKGGKCRDTNLLEGEIVSRSNIKSLSQMSLQEILQADHQPQMDGSRQVNLIGSGNSKTAKPQNGKVYNQSQRSSNQNKEKGASKRKTAGANNNPNKQSKMSLFNQTSDQATFKFFHKNNKRLYDDNESAFNQQAQFRSPKVNSSWQGDLLAFNQDSN